MEILNSLIQGDDEMANETIKALLMIAMFGALEFALSFQRIWEATAFICRAASSFLMPIAPVERIPVAARVQRNTR